MKHISLFIFLFSLIPTAAFAKKLIPIDSDPTPAKGLVVTVRDEKTTVSGAHVWVETAAGKLLAEGETSKDGRFTADVADGVLAASVSITATAPGHAAVSFLENVSHRVALELTSNPVDEYSVMTGRLTGFKESDDETKATAGLVAKSLEVSDLVQLDSSSFISPLKDTIDVFGSRQVPSNLVLPDQTFPVYFIPVHVDKPIYRLPILSGSSSRYFGVSGTLNVQEAINAIRGGTGWDIINLLEFNKVGITRPIPAQGTGTINVDVVSDVQIRDVVRLKPGRNTTPVAESRRLAVALWEPLQGIFVPTDVKLVQSDDLALTTVENRSAKVIDILVSKDGDHFRGAWVNKAATAMPDAGLTADMTVDRLDSTWMIQGGESAQIAMAHLESHFKTSVGNTRYEDRWVVVGPRRAQFRLPTVAYHAISGQLGTISHVSVDLLQMGHGSYPFIDGENSSVDMAAIEKVRKEIH